VRAPLLSRAVEIGLARGSHLRSLLVGYWESSDSEPRIAWRLADSLSPRGFLGFPASKPAPDRSTMSPTRRLIDGEMRVLCVLSKSESDVLEGKIAGWRSRSAPPCIPTIDGKWARAVSV
jgi:hypothetical protein